MLVRDCMSARPVTVREDADYKVALRLMQDHALHHVPVLDQRENLVGIVAERDLLLAATHHMQAAVDVAEVMHRDVVTTTGDAPIGEAAALMVDHRIGGLPVLDAGRRLVGVITEADIFRAFVASERAAGAVRAG
ncbi:MAG: CBS domain-containing protein [Burkholderiales bacterium]